MAVTRDHPLDRLVARRTDSIGQQEMLATSLRSKWTVCFQDGQFETFEAHRMDRFDGFTTFTDYTARSGVADFVGCVNNVFVKYILRDRGVSALGDKSAEGR